MHARRHPRRGRRYPHGIAHLWSPLCCRAVVGELEAIVGAPRLRARLPNIGAALRGDLQSDRLLGAGLRAWYRLE